LNIGCGIGTSIKELVHLIRNISGFDGEIIWDSSKPDGASKKVLDITKMKAVLGWYPGTLLKNGLKKTFNWLIGNYTEAMRRE